MKYQIGDLVQIIMDKVDNKHKQYNGFYKIKEIKRTFDGVYLYKLKGIPNWGTEDMISPVNIDKEIIKSIRT